MGLTEEELPPLVDAWRQSNPNIVKFWWNVDHAVMEAVKFKHHHFQLWSDLLLQGGMLFITLPSGRKLAYVKPKLGTNKFGGQCITYEGIGGTKKWERLDSYGPKFVENIVQATARDILCYAMKTLQLLLHCHAHSRWEVVIEADPRMSLEAVCEQMGHYSTLGQGTTFKSRWLCDTFYKRLNFSAKRQTHLHLVVEIENFISVFVKMGRSSPVDIRDGRPFYVHPERRNLTCQSANTTAKVTMILLLLTHFLLSRTKPVHCVRSDQSYISALPLPETPKERRCGQSLQPLRSGDRIYSHRTTPAVSAVLDDTNQKERELGLFSEMPS